jgi:hypothetical protein
MTPHIGFVLSHEQFPAPQLLELGVAAEEAQFDELWASDHFHPWQDNQGHSDQAWITLAAVGSAHAPSPWYRCHLPIVSLSASDPGPGFCFTRSIVAWACFPWARLR